jgi:pimeloyl-ACP methyl ester carboxylesterase
MLKKILGILALFLLLALSVSCSNKVTLTIDKGKVTNSKGELLKYYLAKRSENKLSDKLLVMIQGSGRDSITNRFGMGAGGASLGFDILYLEKYAFDDKELFDKTNCRERRIEDIEFVMNHVIKGIYDNNLKEVLLVADSEGGSIAPKIANDLEEVTHMIIMGSGGYSQAKELEVLLEKELTSNEQGIFRKVGIRNKEDLLNKFNQIRKNPSYKKTWWGCTYKRWNSYLDYEPEKNILNLDIPVLFIIGKDDKSVPYESVEYLANKLGDKENFSFEIIHGLNHSFADESGNNKMKEIMKKIILPWYKENMIKE